MRKDQKERLYIDQLHLHYTPVRKTSCAGLRRLGSARYTALLWNIACAQRSTETRWRFTYIAMDRFSFEVLFGHKSPRVTLDSPDVRWYRKCFKGALEEIWVKMSKVAIRGSSERFVDLTKELSSYVSGVKHC